MKLTHIISCSRCGVSFDVYRTGCYNCCLQPSPPSPTREVQQRVMEAFSDGSARVFFIGSEILRPNGGSPRVRHHITITTAEEYP